MTNEPENLILKQLAILRDEMREGFAKLTAEGAITNEKLGTVAQTLVSVQRDVRGLQRDVSMLKDSVGTLGIAIDEHTRRLDKIEKHLGLNAERH